MELTPEDVDALLDFAFERHFEGSGLFGTPQTAMQMVNKLKAIDVDDIACLIDFDAPSRISLGTIAVNLTICYSRVGRNPFSFRAVDSRLRGNDSQRYSLSLR